MINTQAKEKPIDLDGDVQVHSIFKTIQGEGPYAGMPAIFIRLAGCNLDCPWCDTIYTGADVQTSAPDVVLDKVIALAENTPAKTKLIVISGGEPFRQNFSLLAMMLHKAGFIIQIETNGTLFLDNFPYHLVTLVCSPKIGKIHKSLIPYIRFYKYVAEANSISIADGLPVSVLGNKVRTCVVRPPANLPIKVYLQAMDSQDPIENEKNLKAVVSSCQTFGHTLCLQMHKIIGVE